MRKFASALLVAVLVLPSLLEAQRRGAAQAAPRQHELGVDVGISYYDPDVGEGGFRIGTPLDVRAGLPSRGKVMWEPRLFFLLDTSGGEGRHQISPGVNVLHPVGTGTHRRGMFVTGGAGLNLIDEGARSGTGFSLNAAVGWRRPQRAGGALRYELGIRWDSEIEDGPAVIAPSALSFGGRVGLSLWR